MSNVTELEKRVFTLDVLNQYVNITNNLEDEQAVYHETCRAFVELLGIEHSGMSIINPDQVLSTIVSEYPDTGAIGREIEATGKFMDEMKRAKTPVFVNNVATYPDFEDKGRDTLIKSGIQAIAFLPILFENQLIGIITLDILEANREFHPDMVENAKTLLNQTTVTLQRIRLLQSMRRQTEQLQQIGIFSEFAQTNPEIPTILGQALKTLISLVPVLYANVLLYDEDLYELRIVAHQYKNRTTISVHEPISVPIDGTAVGYVWKSQNHLIFPDITQETKLKLSEIAGMKSLVIYPLMARGNKIGILEIGAEIPQAYTETDRTLITQMSNQLAVSLENARAYRHSQRVAEIQTLVNEITLKIEQEASMVGILEVTAEELGKALHARKVRIRLGRIENEVFNE